LVHIIISSCVALDDAKYLKRFGADLETIPRGIHGELKPVDGQDDGASIARGPQISLGIVQGFKLKILDLEDSEYNARRIVGYAIQRLQSVSGIRFPFSLRPQILAYNYPTDYGGFAWRSNIYMSTRVKGPFHWWIRAVLHEILHTWGYPYAPKLDHKKNQNCIMDVAARGWLCPAEVRWAQKKWGLPAKKFTPWALRDLVAKIKMARGYNKKNLEVRLVNWIKLWDKVPMANTKNIAPLKIVK